MEERNLLNFVRFISTVLVAIAGDDTIILSRKISQAETRPGSEQETLQPKIATRTFDRWRRACAKGTIISIPSVLDAREQFYCSRRMLW